MDFGLRQDDVDGDHRVIVAPTLNNSANDTNRMIPLLNRIRAKLRRQAREISADSGCCTDENLKSLSRRRVRGHIATGRQKHVAASATSDGASSPWVQNMTRRMKQGGFRSRYRLRKQVVEPVFGQIEHARGIRQFLLRGQQKVAAEWTLLCTAHNILKLAQAWT